MAENQHALLPFEAGFLAGMVFRCIFVAVSFTAPSEYFYAEKMGKCKWMWMAFLSRGGEHGKNIQKQLVDTHTAPR